MLITIKQKNRLEYLIETLIFLNKYRGYKLIKNFPLITLIYAELN